MTARRETHLPDQDGNCVLFTSSTGTWEKLEGSTYKFTDIESGVSVQEDIIFIDDNNMYIDYQTLDLLLR
ncbi:MAG: hypothetical protein IIB06_10040 [Bacteroidetes bacterium]|nr:hypothetical protein [Bacteroidota bacterium]